MTTIYLIGFGSGWLIWLVSLTVPTELRPVLWVIAMVIELATPWVGGAGSTAGRWTTGTCRTDRPVHHHRCWVARWPACSSPCRTTHRHT